MLMTRMLQQILQRHISSFSSCFLLADEFCQLAARQTRSQLSCGGSPVKLDHLPAIPYTKMILEDSVQESVDRNNLYPYNLD